MANNGYVKLFIGPMFSGKSSGMIDAVDKYHNADKSCAIATYIGDTRYDAFAKNGGIVTHSKREFSKLPIYKSDTLSAIVEVLSKYDVIGIDEVQFFSDCVEIVSYLANNGKIVICAGLDATFKMKSFGRIGDLIAISEDVIKLKSVCMVCHREASFTAKISEGDDELDIGGFDKYISVCRNCMPKYNPSNIVV